MHPYLVTRINLVCERNKRIYYLLLLLLTIQIMARYVYTAHVDLIYIYIKIHFFAWMVKKLLS
jgi:hypothetical protein